MAHEDMDIVYDEAKESMEKAIRSLRAEIQRVRTGRASTALLDGIQIDYYGTATPINQLANLATPDPRLIVISPYDKSAIGAVEKAILASDLGLTPSNDGKVVRLNIPPLTEERRRNLVKIAQGEAESARNQIRQIRRDGNDTFKSMEKDKEISEDQMHDGQDAVQKLTDTYVGKVNDILKAKEKEIMEV